MLKVTTVVVVTTQQWRGSLEFTTEIPFMLVTTTRYVTFHKWYSWTRRVHFAVLQLILEHWFHQTAVARVASVSARVGRESWNKSKKRNEGGRVGQKILLLSPSPFFLFLLTSLKLLCSTRTETLVMQPNQCGNVGTGNRQCRWQSLKGHFFIFTFSKNWRRVWKVMLYPQTNRNNHTEKCDTFVKYYVKQTFKVPVSRCFCWDRIVIVWMAEIGKL